MSSPVVTDPEGKPIREGALAILHPTGQLVRVSAICCEVGDEPAGQVYITFFGSEQRCPCPVFWQGDSLVCYDLRAGTALIAAAEEHVLADGDDASQQASIASAAQNDIDALMFELGLDGLEAEGRDAMRRFLTVAWLRGSTWGVQHFSGQAVEAAAATVVNVLASMAKGGDDAE